MTTLEHLFNGRHEVLGAGWDGAGYERHFASVVVNVLAAVQEREGREDGDPRPSLTQAVRWCIIACEVRRGTRFTSFDEFDRTAMPIRVWGHSDDSSFEAAMHRLLLHVGAVALELAEDPGFDEPVAANNLILAAVAAASAIDAYEAP